MRYRTPGRRWLVALLTVVACKGTPTDKTSTVSPTESVEVYLGRAERAVSTPFAPGSLIIPMDTTYQDSGTLRAFGLVYQLLRQGVVVSWAVLTGKTQGGVDFTASGTDLQTGATITNHGYRGGPFIIDASNRDAALPIINAWHAAGNVTTVHSATVPFTADIRRKLVSAPKIAVLADGNEIIAFTNLNAAGIPDSTGQAWPTFADPTRNYPGFPDVLSTSEVRGANAGGPPDGALLRADGTPAYCHISSMHYAVPLDDEVVREVRAWLNAGPTTHAYAQCLAITVFENSASGRYITTNGLVDDGATPNPITNRFPDDPLAQFDGSFRADGGSVNSIGLAAGSAFRPNTRTLINLSSAPLTSRIVWLSGFLDGNTSKGRVTYLAGHDYSTALPISSNPQTNGVRLMMNSLFESPCAEVAVQPTLTLTKSAPATTTASTITFTISFSNAGPGIADNAVLRDPIPAGTTFVSATGGGTFSGGVVTWNLGNLAPGASGSRSFTVSVATDGTYTNQATLTYFVGLTQKQQSSNTTSTVRDTVAPETTIVSGPPARSSSTSATFDFSSNESPVTFECRLDGAATFTPCTDPVTFTGLAEGAHTLEVRARDAAGNADPTPATHNWTVDTTPPETTIVSGPPAQTSSTSATFDFASNESPVTFECRLDGAATFTPCTDPVTFAGLAEGAHTLHVRARDAAGNVDPTPATHNWTVDTTPPDTTIVSAPPAFSNSTSATFDFASEPGATFECNLDGGGFATCTDPVTFGPLSQGSHTLAVRARDAAGNVDPTPATHTWTVDSVVPSPPVITTPADGSFTNNPSVTVSGTAEPLATVRVFLDGSSVGTTQADSGGSWSLAIGTVSEGSHQLRAQARDQAGNTSGLSAITTFTVDTVAPAVPVVQAPANGSFTNNPRPTVSGTAEANATVTVFLDGSVAGTTVASAEGAWSFLPAGNLADGIHTAAARATDAAGNSSATSPQNTFTVDTMPPPQPAIATPTPGQAVNTPRPTVSGTAEAGARVEVRVDGTLVGTVTASADGTWSYTLTAAQALPDGGHSATARAIDAAGNLSVPAGPINFTVDTVAPPAPVVSTPAPGSRINTATPTVSGTAEADASVRVFIDSVQVGVVTASGSGVWSYTLTPGQALRDGDHSVSAQASDAAGNTGPVSTPHTFVVDTVAPAAPLIAQPPNGSSTIDSTPTVSGTAEALARVDLLRDGAPAGSTNADAAGTWSLTLAALADGTYTLTARATDLAGNPSPLSSPTVFTVDTAAPAAPVITLPAAGSFTNDNTPDVGGTGEPGATITVAIDGTPRATATVAANGAWTATVPTVLADGAHTATAIATDAAGNTSPASSPVSFTVDTAAPAAPTIAAPPSGQVTNDNTPLVAGNAEPSAFVDVVLDGALVATTTASGTGAWSVELLTVGEGPHELRARARDAAGNASALSAPTSFTVDTLAPAAPVLQQPANGSATNQRQPPISGTAEPQSRVTVILDGVVAGTTTASAAGAWSFTPPAPLEDGPHTTAARATDAAGNTSATSATVTFTVDTVPPATPAIATPAPGALVNTARPTISGTADASVQVEVRVDGAVVGTVAADPSGAWSYTLAANQSLADGGHSATARAFDAAGNQSLASAPVGFTVDTQGPPAPVVTTPAPGSRTNDTTPEISGSAEGSASVTVFVDGIARGTVTASPAGSWSYTLTAAQALSEGNHTVSAQATDVAGNPGPASVPHTFVVDLTAPAPPVISQPASGTSTSNPTPTVSGTSEAFAVVEVSVDGVPRASAAADAGGLWSLSVGPLPDGTYALTATATDAAGNTSAASAATTLTIDTEAPAAPVITSPADGAMLRSGTPVIVGTAEAGATVTVFDGTNALGTANADGTGSWTFNVPPASPLGDGPHDLSATARDRAGNTGPRSATVRIIVDTTAPSAPLITAPANGAQLNQPRPTFSGTAEIGATVRLTVDGVLVGTGIAGGGGQWSITPDNPIADGSHTATATAVDTAGNTSAPSSPVSFTIDTSAPGTARIDSPTNNAQLNTQTPTIAGVADPGSRVDVFVDGNLAGSVTTGASGNWSFPIPASSPLSEGPHTLTARAVDGAGNPGPLSSPVDIVIDITPPDAPVITVPSDNARLNTATPTIAGTATPGDQVQIRVDGNLVGSVVASAQAAWSYTLTPAQALLEGPHVATARAIDAAGNQSPDDSVSFDVDLTGPAAPIVLAPPNGSRIRETQPTISGTADLGTRVTVTVGGSAVGTVPTDPNGSWAYRLTAAQALTEGTYVARAFATDDAGNAGPLSAPVTFTVDLTAPAAPSIALPTEGAAVASSRPIVSGTAEPGATVAVTVDGQAAGSTLADGSGAWSLQVGIVLADGPHQVTATATDAAGNTSSPSAPRGFTTDTVAPAAPAITAPPGGARLNDARPTIAGTAEPGVRVSVVVDGSAVGEVVALADGTWSYRLTAGQALADGAHTTTATTRDAAGNASDQAAPVSFSIDTEPPAAPQIATPTDGTRTNDPRPLIGGRAEPGATVLVLLNGQPLGTTTAGPDGAWSLVPGAPLAEGTYGVTARATDDHGNTGATSSPVTFVVDRTPPAAPLILTPPDGSQIADATPMVTGIAEPGATITVLVDGVPVGTTVADPSGNWTLTVPDASALVEGSHALSAQATDIAGNTGGTSNVVHVIVDLTGPAVPVIVQPREGERTGDRTPVVSGTAGSGDRVDVRVDGILVGSVVADSAGNWSYELTPAQSLGDGPHQATAQARDGAGNPSAESAPVSFTVDASAPAAPVILVPSDGSRTKETRPTISGTAEPQTTVTVTLDGSPVGTAPADPGGAWSFTPAPEQALAAGTHVARAFSTDAAGNQSPTSAPVTFTVDLEAPVAPQIVSPAEGEAVGTNQPTIRGTAEPGARVDVAIDGAPAGSALADASGAWTLALTGALADGPHSASAVAIDPAGNSSPPSPVRNFLVDTTAPAAPVIREPAEGATLNTSTPVVAGDAEPGARVTVSVDGHVVGVATADAEGRWSYRLTPGQALADGEHIAGATARDAAGNGADAQPVTFSIDTVPPGVPQILAPPDGTRTSSRRPAVSGTGEPGSTIQVFDGLQLVGEAPVAPDGTWTFTPAQDLADGTHAFAARAIDDHGNASARSAAVSVIVDTTPPAAPVVLAPAHMSRTNNPTPTVSGTSEPDARVEVFIDDALVGEATADGTGAWRYTLTLAQALSEGSHGVAARATDSVGNTGPLSSPNVFTVDTQVPAPPVITRPANGERVPTPRPQIAGTAEPGVQVVLLLDGTQVALVRAASDGSWSYTLSDAQSLRDGQHQATARAVDAAGNFSAPSTPVVFVVDTIAPEPPVVTSPAPGSEVREAPTIAGTAEPGAEVTIFVDGVLFGTATAGEDGTWRYEPAADQTLPDGEHAITARATDGAGNESGPSAEVRFVTDTTAPAAPTIVIPADGATINDPTPDVMGVAEPGAEVEVFVDGVAVGRARADDQGRWSLTVPIDLPDGEHTVAARASDEAGNQGPLSAPNRFTVDAVAPPQPTLDPLPPLTNDPRPHLSGTAEPGAQVDVYVDGTLVGTTTVDENGRWSFDPPSDLPDGSHEVSAVARDAGGNTSPPATGQTTIDTTPPEAPVIVEPEDGKIYLEEPAIRGTASPGVHVVAILDGVELPAVQADAAGQWRVVARISLGEHVLVAFAHDEAGNVSPPSNAVLFYFGFTDERGGTLFNPKGAGCTCSTEGRSSGLPPLWVLLAAVLLWARRRARAERS